MQNSVTLPVLDGLFQQRQAELIALLERFTTDDGRHQTVFAPLKLYRYETPPRQRIPYWQEASLCIIAQGSKHVTLGGESYTYDPEHYLLATMDLPMVCQMIRRADEGPYLGLRLSLDMTQVAELIIDAQLPAPDTRNSARGVTINPLDTELMDAIVRLVRLLDSPRDLSVLAPMAMRELYYRLLTGDQAVRLYRMVATNGQLRQIARAVNFLKSNFSEQLRVEDLAREVNMSPSGLHHHFKAITAMSPLQYQKQLRLQEARRLMLDEGLDAATAGSYVGYESPSQFSREYGRLFGAPPLKDISRLRNASGPDSGKNQADLWVD